MTDNRDNTTAPDSSTSAIAVDERDATVAERGFFTRLYTGSGGIDVIGKRRTWYWVTAVALLVCIGAMVFRGFTLGIDFEGGTRMTMPPANVTEEQAEEVFEEATGVTPDLVQIIGAGDARVLEITSERLGEDTINDARMALYEEFQPVDASGESTPDAIGDSTVSESWGGAVTERMILAMAVFLALVFAYIAFSFERDMAIAAIAALVVDGVVIAGIYSLVGFEVTPATVIGLLTVLSFSLYDTVVVFDKVRENTAGFRNSTRRTYAEQVNLAVNQTIMRSINTTVSSLLPIIALMVIAVGMLGVGTLKDLALVQVIGIIQGTFSSIFLAASLLVSLKRRQKIHAEHDRKVADARAAGTAPEFGDHIGDGRTGSLDDVDGEAATADGSSPAKTPVRRPIATPTPPTRNTAAGDIAPKRGDGRDGEAGEARPSTWRPGR
ncbi:protein translocase subunit SecF [Corynebacterium xerosis]|uniref:protein translocase subunit SecF n=1 Tax=Corynebacterium xerosis TaxID=1725 RepID=UPI000EABF78C|nr:protein translocase subunit SecF [Corynebacterium xerosis]AYJ32445.1 protein translocase subunit SecF [Corynebacterium xerosis]